MQAPQRMRAMLRQNVSVHPRICIDGINIYSIAIFRGGGRFFGVPFFIGMGSRERKGKSFDAAQYCSRRKNAVSRKLNPVFDFFVYTVLSERHRE